MRTYIYILKLLPQYRNQENWDDRDNKALEEHSKRLERQTKRGTVKFVGRTDLPIDNEENFGLVVFEAENDDLAELFAQSDPAVMGKLMTATCFPFKHVY
ncbi:MAG: YciI family protein [Flavobacteriales bacterium]|nr:YciI family protein [Flavobacteriales bacterium]